MSTVIGIKTDNGIWIGGDTRLTSDEGYIRPSMYSKIFRNEKYLIAFVGSTRCGHLLNEEHFEVPDDIEMLPDQIREWFEENGFLLITSDSTHEQKCSFIVGVNGKLYEILADFAMNEIEQYTSLGSGSMIAFGSLHTTENLDGVTPEERIDLALKAAYAFDAATGSPFTIHKL